MSEPVKKPNPLNVVGGIVGAAVGWMLGEYCGDPLWIPGLAMFVFMMLFVRTPIRPKYFRGAIGTTGAHLTWFIVGSVVGGMWAAVALDIVVLAIGIIWLWLFPGLFSALFLGLIQVGALAVNIYSMSLVSLSSLEHRALTVHCLFRLMAVVFLVTGYRRLHRERSIPSPIPSVAIP